MTTFEDKFEDIKRLSLTPLELYLDGKATQFEKTAYAQVSKVVFELASKHEVKLYAHLVQHLERYYAHVITDSLRNLHGAALLREFVRLGENQETIGRFYKNQFEYLGRNYIKRTKSKTFEDIARNSFQSIIYEDIKHDLTKIILLMVEEKREGFDTTDHWLLKDTVRLIANLGGRLLQCYEEDIEKPYLAATRTYYHTKSTLWSLNDSVATYLHKCDAVLREEKQFVLTTLHATSDVRVQNVLERELLFDKVQVLMEREQTGLRYMLEQRQWSDVSLMYKFVLRVGQGAEDMARIVREHIEARGKLLWHHRLTKEQARVKEKAATAAASSNRANSNNSNNNESNTSNNSSEGNDDHEMIQALFRMFDECTTMVKTQFNNHLRFQESFKRGFDFIVNYVPANNNSHNSSSPTAPAQPTSSPAKINLVELLANYCDFLLKKSTGTTTSHEANNANSNSSSSNNQKLDDKEIEKALEQVISLFSFVHDKDIFRSLYQHALAQRLLNMTSISDDLERFVIGRLKLLCGQSFTSTLEVMLFDMTHSDEENDAFQVFLSQSKMTTMTTNDTFDTANTDKVMDVHSVNNDSGSSDIVSPVGKKSGSIFSLFGDRNNAISPTKNNNNANANSNVSSNSKNMKNSVVQCPISEFSVQVLTNGQWPSCFQSFDRVLMPRSMQDAMSLFTTYFKNKHDGKRLTWIQELGQVVLHGKWQKLPKPFIMQMAPLQAAVLMLFNECDSFTINNSNSNSGHSNSHSNSNGTIVLSFQEIMTRLHIEEDALKRVLDSLCFAKFKLLTRTRPLSEGRTSKEDDTFQVNSSFTSKSIRFKLTLPILTTTQKSTQQIDKDREHVIEACIVRIMKARKTLAHTSLMSEVLSQLQWFRPEPSFVKKRIEGLIHREYIERDPEDRTMYRYLA